MKRLTGLLQSHRLLRADGLAVNPELVEVGPGRQGPVEVIQTVPRDPTKPRRELAVYQGSAESSIHVEDLKGAVAGLGGRNQRTLPPA